MIAKTFRANYETFDRLMRDDNNGDIQFIGYRKHIVDNRDNDIVHCFNDGPADKNDWIIRAKEECDYYTWYEYFWAEHPTLGTVFGHIDDGVFVKGGKKALKAFLETFSYSEFCYGDI